MATKAILNSSESVEWYTPAPYVEAAREVLGGIELDPASCAEAQETVKAARYYTLNYDRTGESSEQGAFQADGLLRPWVARSVFLNPPYGTRDGKSNQALWSAKVIAAYSNAAFLDDVSPGPAKERALTPAVVGAIRSAILLVNASTSELWFKPLWRFPICFTDHRIRFNYPKLRRFSHVSIRGKDNAQRRRALAEKPVRIFVHQKGIATAVTATGWRVPGKGKLTRDESKALVLPFKDAYGFDDYFDCDAIHFDRLDKPAQPTKGQAFVYLGPDPLIFAYHYKQFGPVVQAMKIHAGPRRERRLITLKSPDGAPFADVPKARIA
jgi:hypothetical protein